MLEPQARPAVRRRAAARVRRAHQHLLPFLHVAAHDLREVAVAHPGLHGDGHGLARGPRHEETAREGALTRELRVGQLGVVLGSLRPASSRIFCPVAWRMGLSFSCCSGVRPSDLVSRSRTCSADCGAPPLVRPGPPLARMGTLSSPGRRKRRAELGTLSTPSFWATTRRTLAVIPGRSLSSGLRAEMTTL